MLLYAVAQLSGVLGVQFTGAPRFLGTPRLSLIYDIPTIICIIHMLYYICFSIINNNVLTVLNS